MKSAVRRLSWAITVLIGFLAIGVGMGHGQQIFRGYYGSTPPKFATATTFKGAFNFCRAMFSSNRREKRGWETDYPGADINFSIRLADAHGRLMVVMLHNTDIPDGWEREGEDREYFLKFSPDAYSVGIDIAIYALTH